MTQIMTETTSSLAAIIPDRAPAALLRRVPRQERGRVRVEKILDAAADVIAETGVEAATTNAIAAKANTSVGSLYQFFPNKEAIVDALASRFQTELRQLNDVAMSPEVVLNAPLPELVDGVVNALLQYHEENPAYRHVYQATHCSDAPDEKDAELHRAVVRRVEQVLVVRAPEMESTTKHLHATVAVLSVHALLGFAMTASPLMRMGIVQELKAMIVTYLQEAINGATLRSLSSVA